MAAYLALTLAKQGYQVGLLDVDLHGPSIPKMLGLRGNLDIAPDHQIIPQPYSARLKVVSIESMLEDTDSAMIWRGPLKHGVIQQFLADCRWDDLDFLIIDSPPGTGDEPLSVAKLIPEAKAIIVTTPQEVALADVRKSINFCRKVKLEIAGLVENMSGLHCPHCQGFIPIFRTGGGKRTAESMRLKYLGALPLIRQWLRGRPGAAGAGERCRHSFQTGPARVYQCCAGELENAREDGRSPGQYHSLRPEAVALRVARCGFEGDDLAPADSPGSNPSFFGRHAEALGACPKIVISSRR